MFLPAFRMVTRETWQIITYQKRLFDLNSKGMGGFSGTTNLAAMMELTGEDFTKLPAYS
jgi:hypothetical protein